MRWAATFDVWGTLLRIEELYGAAAAALSGLLGQPEGEVLQLLDQAYSSVKAARRRGLIDERDVVSSSLCAAFESFQGVTASDLFWALSRAVNAANPARLVVEGAERALEELREEGYALGIVSNVVFWPGYLTRVVLDRVGLSRFFRVQVYADEEKCLKPSPRIFTKALRELGAEPSESAHVGDSPQEDLAGALASEMAGVLIDRGRRGTLVDRRLRIAVVESVHKVPPALAELTRA